MTRISQPGNPNHVPVNIDVKLQVFHGPNLLTPYQAVLLELNPPFEQSLDITRIRSALSELLPDQAEKITIPLDENLSFAVLCTLLTGNLLGEMHGNGLPMETRQLQDGRFLILVGFLDSTASSTALLAAVDLTHAIFSHSPGSKVDAARVRSRFFSAMQRIKQGHPDAVSRALIDVALKRGISVYPLPAEAQTWSFGQGVHAHRFFEAANQADSLTGSRISRNKFWSNRFIRGLGLPGVIHGIAYNEQQAIHLATKIGFPLVVKPVNSGKGKGVSVGILNDQDLRQAFNRAAAIATGEVLIERFVAGDNYRLVVSGCKLIRASRLRHAQVIGDGKSTLRQLIGKLSSSDDQDTAMMSSNGPSLDQELVDFLARQGLSISDRPALGQQVVLNDTPHIQRGGTLLDMTDQFHPDNVALAETVARNYHLDAVGIDFISPDPRVSWREIDCAIIEVNATPGIGRVVAERVLEQKFPDGFDGRIPSILLLDTPAEVVDQVLSVLHGRGLEVGFSDEKTTRAGGIERFTPNDDLARRVLGLLLDPVCEILVLSCSPGAIERHGLLHPRFDLVIHHGIESGAEILALIRQHSNRQLNCAASDWNNKKIDDAVNDLL